MKVQRPTQTQSQLPADYFRQVVNEHDGRLNHKKVQRPNTYLPGQLDLLGEGNPATCLQIGGFALINPRLIGPGINQLLSDLGRQLPLDFVISDVYEPERSYEAALVDGAWNVTGEKIKRIGSEIISNRLAALSQGSDEYPRGLPLNRVVNYVPRSLLESGALENGVLKLDGREVEIKFGFVTTPVNDHAPAVELLTSNGIGNVYNEKPYGQAMNPQLPDIIERQMLAGAKGVDFFVYGEAITYLKEHEDLLRQFGNLTAIHAVCSEPWLPEPGREWLMIEEIAGSGVFADTASHSAAMTDDFIRWWCRNEGLSLNNASLDAFDRARILGYEAGDLHLETYGTTKGSLSTKDGRVEIYLSGGKGAGGRPGGSQGTEESFLGMVLEFEKGRAIVNLGYPKKHNPHVVYIPDDRAEKVECHEILNGALGYNVMLADWAVKSQGHDIADGRIQNCSTAARNAMAYLTRAYAQAKQEGYLLSFYPLGEIPMGNFEQGAVYPSIEIAGTQSAFEVMGKSAGINRNKFPFSLS